MKISIAPPIQAHVPRKLPVASASVAPEARSSPPPATIDLRRQLKFGDSEVDEAGTMLVELSVLVYEGPDHIRRTFHTLDVDDVRVMSAGAPHQAKGKWMDARTVGTQPAQAPRALALRHGGDVLIAFRGTQNWRDWALDFCLWPAPAWPLRHQGFEWTWHEVKSQIEAWLMEVERHLGHKPNVYLGGHSLGGAVATLAAVDLAATHPIARVVTLGCPRAGGWLWRKRYRASGAAPAADGAPRCLPDITTDVRQIVGRVVMWLAFSLPWSWWTRMFLPLIPAAAEQLARSVGQHSAARYLGFMPPTALYRAMYPPQMPPGQPEAAAAIAR